MLVTVNNTPFKVKIAVTPEAIRRGMQKQRFESENEGMFFIVREDEHCYWMKDCIIPLDIIFIKDGEIVKIYENCPPCDGDNCPTYCSDADRVLEIGGGMSKKFGLKEGDTVTVQLF
jgi:uncharacterized membrane protein (UPF0127 family)